MALIKCPECGREISDRAVFCPHCGFPLSENKSFEDEEENKAEIQKLCTFMGSKSIATPIVAAVLIEVIVGILLAIGLNTSRGFLIFALVAGLFLEITIPFMLVHDIKEIVAINRMDGKSLCLDKDNKVIFVEGNDGKFLFRKPLSKIFQFDGPRALVITYRKDDNSMAKFICGMTTREQIIELRKLINK